jgi:hypothetical protein
MDDMEKSKFFTLMELELRPLGHPARSQSIHRLCSPRTLVYTHVKDYAITHVTPHYIYYIIQYFLLNLRCVQFHIKQSHIGFPHKFSTVRFLV